MKTYSVIIKPYLTEKSAIDQSKGVYSFLVRREAGKIEVKNAVEKIYGKKVSKVTTCLKPKKIRLVGRSKILTKRDHIKVAKVTFIGKESIDISKVSGKKSEEKIVKKTKKIKQD